MRFRTLAVVLTLLIATGASLLIYLHFNPDIETAWYFGGQLEQSEDGSSYICQDGVVYVKIKESGAAQLWATQPDSRTKDGQKHCGKGSAAGVNYLEVVTLQTIYPDSGDAVVIDPIDRCRYYGRLEKSQHKPAAPGGFLEGLGAKAMEVAGVSPLHDWSVSVKFRKCDSTPELTEVSKGSIPLGSLIKPIPAGSRLLFQN